jgi:hypothetical protein
LEIDRILTRVEGGAVLREQNALPCGIWITVNLTAKSAIDNCRAGRAAKGATLVTCSNQAHFHDLEVIGVWKCVLLFIPIFP